MSSRGLPAPEAYNLFDLAQEMQAVPGDDSPQQPATQESEQRTPIAPYITIEEAHRRRQAEAARQQSATTEAGPEGPESGPSFTEGIITERRPRGGSASSEVYPPPPAPVPRRPHTSELDGQFHDPNQMAPIHKPEPRQPEPDWSSMSDEELEAAEEEANYRLEILEATVDVTRGRLAKAEENHKAENEKIIGTIGGDAGWAANLGAIGGIAAEAAKAGAKRGAVAGAAAGPAGIAIGAAKGAALAAAGTGAKAAYEYGNRRVQIRRQGERQDEVFRELEEAAALLDRIQKVRAGRR
jgi:hypothetical protein